MSVSLRGPWYYTKPDLRNANNFCRKFILNLYMNALPLTLLSMQTVLVTSCKSLTQEKIHHYFPFYYPTTIFALHVDTFEVSIRVCSPNNKEKRDNPPGIFFFKKLSPTKKNYSMMSVTRNSLLSVCPWRVGIWFGWGLPSLHCVHEPLKQADEKVHLLSSASHSSASQVGHMLY